MQPILLGSVSFIDLAIRKTNPPALVINATGQAPTSGYADISLHPVSYTTAPEDGIYEFELQGVPPFEQGATIITKVIAKTYEWVDYPAELKGIRVMAEQNEQTALIEEAEALDPQEDEEDNDDFFEDEEDNMYDDFRYDDFEEDVRDKGK